MNTNEKNESNARLRDAAPELLEALKKTVSALEMLGEEGEDLDAGREAIAKAEGL